MIESLRWQLDNVTTFLYAGGPVLWAIIVVAAFIGFLITERYWFVLGVFPAQAKHLTSHWQQERAHNRKLARYQRTALLSQAQLQLRQSLPLLKVMVAICPLLGLLGTVTGMIEVFDVVTTLGTGNARAMASGISRATIPTMAGMVVALPGLYFCLALEQRVNRSVKQLSDRLKMS
jgi:biopolymer transport protein ExbB